jgi:hypothetical protein
MKRVRAGHYISRANRHYTYQMQDSGWWTVGRITESGNQHIEDFRSYRQAKEFISIAEEN